MILPPRHWIAALAALLCPASADAGGMLRVLAEAAAEGGAAWVADGALVVGSPNAAGRPGSRPLESHAPVVLPTDTTAWTPLGAGCAGPLTAESKQGTLVLKVLQSDPVPATLATFLPVGLAPALAQLPVGVTPCQAWVGDVGPAPGVELVAVWQIGDILGVTVWAMPAPGLLPSPPAGK
jgi:hypothetical protein